MSFCPFETKNTPLESPRHEGEEEREKGRKEGEPVSRIWGSIKLALLVRHTIMPFNSSGHKEPNILVHRNAHASGYGMV